MQKIHYCQVHEMSLKEFKNTPFYPFFKAYRQIFISKFNVENEKNIDCFAEVSSFRLNSKISGHVRNAKAYMRANKNVVGLDTFYDYHFNLTWFVALSREPNSICSRRIKCKFPILIQNGNKWHVKSWNTWEFSLDLREFQTELLNKPFANTLKISLVRARVQIFLGVKLGEFSDKIIHDKSIFTSKAYIRKRNASTSLAQKRLNSGRNSIKFLRPLANLYS